MNADREKEFREKFLILVRTLLNCMTIVEIEEKVNSYHKYWYCVFSLTSFLFVGGSAMSVLLTAENSYQIFLAAETAGAAFSVSAILFVSQVKQKNLVEIYTMFKVGLQKKTSQYQLYLTGVDSYAECMSWSRKFTVFFTLFVSSTIFSTLLQAIVYNEYDNKNGNTLLYPSRYPWSFNTVCMYVFTYIWQLVTALPIFLIIWANVTFTMVTVVIFQSYTDELVSMLKTVEFNFDNNETVSPKKYDECFHRSQYIKQCIQLHQQLRSNFIQFKSWFNLLFNTEIAYVTIEISFLSYSGWKEKQSYGNSVKLLFFMAVLLAQLYFHCNVGERFYEMNDILRKTLYDIVFDIECSEIQKLVIMFTQQTRIPYTLSGFKTFRVSLQTMTKTLRLSYSFFSVFRASDK